MATIDKAGACVALVGMLLTASGAYGVSAADKCEAAKLKVAGKYSFCRLRAEAKAVKRGRLPNFSKCDAKFSEKWMKAEAGGSCPTTVDEAAQNVTLTANANRTVCQLSGQPRFADNGDGTITDRQTCLQWEKKYKRGDGQDVADLQDADNYYLWAGYCSVDNTKLCQPTTAAATLCAANAEGGTKGCDECAVADGTCTRPYGFDTVWSWVVALNSANFASHNDWRIPKRDELASIVNYAGTTPPVIDATFQGAMCGGSCTFITAPSCSCTQPNTYWSASTFTYSPDYAWYDSFNDSTHSPSNKTNYSYVRAVRSGP